MNRRSSLQLKDQWARPGLAGIFLAVLCSLFASTAQLFLKWGTSQTAENGLLETVTTLPVLLGYCFYGVSTLLFVIALRRGELSVIYPILGLTYIWVVLASAFVFPVESLSPLKVGGSLLIVLGVSLVGGSSRR